MRLVTVTLFVCLLGLAAFWPLSNLVFPAMGPPDVEHAAAAVSSAVGWNVKTLATAWPHLSNNDLMHKSSSHLLNGPRDVSMSAFSLSATAQ